MKLIVATRNKGKVAEIEGMLTPLGFDVESLLDYPDAPETDETGTTFEVNAELKATEAASYFGHAVLADLDKSTVDCVEWASRDRCAIVGEKCAVVGQKCQVVGKKAGHPCP